VKVLLINPTFSAIFPSDYGRPALYEPLGLAYLAAALREAGHEPAILDCVAEGWRVRQRDGEFTRIGLTDLQILERVRKAKPEVIGVTSEFTGFERDSLRIAALVKEAMPSIPVLFGGADATARASEFIANANVDLVIRGEGEQTLCRVVDYFQKHSRLPLDFPGTSAKGQHNPPAEEIANVDEIPMPARDLLRMDIYLEDQTPLMPYAKRRPIGFMISSRGCPYNCVFCSTTKIWRRWRARSAEKVVDEIAFLVKTYGVREIAFQDDSFMVDPDRVRRICEEIIRRKLNISWSVPPGIQANRLSDELLRVMKKSGFYRACFPIESGDPELLEWIRKPVDFEEVETAIKLCHRHGIWTYGNFIIGFPRQSADSIEKTLQYAINCQLDMINVYIAQPYAGSDLYQEFVDLGLLDPERAQASTVFDSKYNTVHFTAQELCAKRQELLKLFLRKRLFRLITPRGIWQVIKKLNSPEKFAYAFRVVSRLAGASLHAGYVNLFGSHVDKPEEILFVEDKHT